MKSHVRSHDNRGSLSDKGPTLTTTIVGEILGNPGTRLPYKRNPLTHQKEIISITLFSARSNLRRAWSQEEKEEETKEYSIGWEIKERVCLHSQKVVTRVTTRKERNPFSENVTMKEHAHRGQKCSPKVKIAEGDTGSQNQKSKGQASRMTTYHNHGSDDPKDHLKIFQAVVKVEHWAMPTWCHMFNSTLIGSARVWFDDLSPKSIDSYDDLKKAFLANFLQQNKSIKDPVEIHHIKQREGESMEDFVTYTDECMHLKRQIEELIKAEKLSHTIKELKQGSEKVFSIWKAFGGNTHDWGSFVEEIDKTTDLHQYLLRLCSQQLETASQITRDAVIIHTKTASQDLKMASECMT
ncbi:reverse transcriptase domain-containing protein [Tanacetum coccineum]